MLDVFAYPPPAPRRAPLLFGRFGARFLVLYTGHIFFVGLIVAAIFALAGRSTYLLNERGVWTEGDALHVRATSVATGRSRSESKTVMEIEVRFRDRAGRTQTAWVSTTDDTTIATARAHGRLHIQYDPLEPSRARLEPSHSMIEYIDFPLAASAAAALPFLIGLGLVRRARRVYREGIATRAVITGLTRTSGSDLGGRVMHVEFIFESVEGSTEGSWTMSRPPPVGTTVWVVHDRKRPRVCVPSAA